MGGETGGPGVGPMTAVFKFVPVTVGTGVNTGRRSDLCTSLRRRGKDGPGTGSAVRTWDTVTMSTTVCVRSCLG